MRLILFVSLAILTMRVFTVCGYANDDFAKRYRAYKDCVQSASAALQALFAKEGH